MQDNFRIGSIASGMGMHLHGLKQIGGVPTWAIECDEAIAQCYRNNHNGQVYAQKVQDVDPADLADIDLLTVTLSCKNASLAKGKNRGETAEDISAGEAVANIIRAKLPKYFMLENVWAYRDFESFKLIQDALAECGYYFQFYKFNLKDWGIAQSRDRLYGLGVRGGAFSAPQIPHLPIKGWYEAIEDLIPRLPETELAPWQQKKFPDLLSEVNSCLIPDHSNWTKLISEEKPASVVRAGHQTFKALIKRVGGGRTSDRLYTPDEPAFAIRALGRNCSNHSRVADAIVGNKIVSVTPRACLRFFGDKETADSVWLPPTKSLANEVVGNGASWVMFRELFKHLRGAGMDLVTKIYEFLDGCDTPGQTVAQIANAIGAGINEVGDALQEGRGKGLFQDSVFGRWILSRDAPEELPSFSVDHLVDSKKPLVNNQPKIMFNFPQTQDICQQIAQMQEQLKQLTDSLQPFKELEDKANEILIEATEHAQLMREKGVEERSLTDWANQIYSAIGGEAVAQSDSEAVKVLQAENASLIAKIDELEKLTDDMDAQLAEQQHLPEVEALQQELEEVRTYNQVLSEKIQELSVELSEAKNEARSKEVSEEIVIEKQGTEEMEAAYRGRTFIEQYTLKSEFKLISWSDIAAVCQQDFDALKEMFLVARLKTQKDFAESIPKLLADHIISTNDRSDLDWVGDGIKKKVENLLSEEVAA